MQTLLPRYSFSFLRQANKQAVPKKQSEWSNPFQFRPNDLLVNIGCLVAETSFEVHVSTAAIHIQERSGSTFVCPTENAHKEMPRQALLFIEGVVRHCTSRHSCKTAKT